MTEAIEENDTVQLKKLAEKQEKPLHGKYLPMKYAAARVLEKEGWTIFWWHVITHTNIRPEPHVAVKRHEDLKNLLDTFTFFGKPTEDNMRADVFDPGYKFKVNMETQQSARSSRGSRVPLRRENRHERECRLSGAIEGLVKLQIGVHRLVNNYGTENYARERNPSISSSLCSDNFDDIDEGDFLPMALKLVVLSSKFLCFSQ